MHRLTHTVHLITETLSNSFFLPASRAFLNLPS
jgi:hypothetical protein